MPYDFSSLREKTRNAEEWLADEFSTIRTGRATPAILDSIRIDSYGAKVPVNHVAGLSVEDAVTLRITPWDKNHIKEIEKAITASDIGVSVSSDSDGLRVAFPKLTAERRTAFVKMIKGKTEEARISVRMARDEVWDDIQKKEKNGEVSEDEKFRLKDEMQKIVDETNKHLAEAEEKKEKVIMS